MAHRLLDPCSQLLHDIPSHPEHKLPVEGAGHRQVGAATIGEVVVDKDGLPVEDAPSLRACAQVHRRSGRTEFL